jgi:hypothetical protein
MWTYKQSTGELMDGSGTRVAIGYSGHLQGKNNPALQDQHDVGPIPQGHWSIQGPPMNTATHGPFVLRLEPEDGTNTFGRSGFLIHGDSVVHPGMASLGCIIMLRAIREEIWNSPDHELQVIA